MSDEALRRASRATAELLNQERVDNAVKNALPLDSDDLAFLKEHADQLALSIELIFSNGAWWLAHTEGTGHLVDAVMNYRRSR